MSPIHRAADKVISAIAAQVCPVGKAGLELRCAIRLVFLVAVGGRGDTVTAGIDSGEHSDDVIRGVGDQLCVMIGKKHAIVLYEI